MRFGSIEPNDTGSFGLRYLPGPGHDDRDKIVPDSTSVDRRHSSRRWVCAAGGCQPPKRPFLKPVWALSAERSAYSGAAANLRSKRKRQMLIVDGQIHLWEKG